MNAKDIKAARCLIEQFEGKATGRYNSSSEKRANPVPGRENTVPGRENIPVSGRLRSGIMACRVGDYCEERHLRAPYEEPELVVPVTKARDWFLDFDDSPVVKCESMTVMKFRKVEVRKRNQRMLFWKRVA